MPAEWEPVHYSLHVGNAQKMVKFNQTESPLSPLHVPRDVGSPQAFQREQISNKVNLENQLSKPLPSDVKEEVEQRAICPLCFVQGTNKVSQIPPPHSPTVGTLAPGRAATRQQAWTAQSLIRTAPCIRGGSGHAQCLDILL